MLCILRGKIKCKCIKCIYNLEGHCISRSVNINNDGKCSNMRTVKLSINGRIILNENK